MYKTHFAVTILRLILIVTSNDSFYKNEWIPISKNDILLYKLKHNFISSRHNVANDDAINDTATTVEEDDMKLLRDGVIKVVTPQIILNTRPFRDPFQENINRNKFQEVSNEYLECKNDPENLEVQNSIQPTEEKHTQKIYNITKAVRKSKAITENEPLKFFNNIVKLNNKINNIGENKDFPRSEDISTAESHNTYEVTEDFGRPKIEVNQENNENKYVYPVPKNNFYASSNNEINSFKNVLSKYNIRNDDKLSNYAMSRLSRNNEFVDKHKNIFIPISVPYGYSYNSMNHLPVNPLIAVYLSNYGYYLPSLYGLHNNYKNLYGYLASNNIHNNLPFGQYKIYSDTDSSN